MLSVWTAVGDNFVMTRGADVHAMGPTAGDQVIACNGRDVPVLAGESSRATLLSALCGHP
jgi:hypothetical protein